MRRFFCARVTAGENLLDEGESHHVRDVLRLRPGAEVALADGEGRRANGTISSVGDRVVIAVSEDAIAEAQRSGISCALSFPKGRRGDIVVQKLTELETDIIIPLIAERSICIPTEKKIERYASVIAGAVKQSGGRSATAIRKPSTLKDAIASAGTPGAILVAEPSAKDRLVNILGGGPTPANCLVVIGPEGGLTDRELEFLKSKGARFFSLGRSILRIETAAIASVAVVKELIS